MYVIAALGIALALSLAGNKLLWDSRDAAKAETATVAASYAQAQAAGKACSDGVVKLAVDAKARQDRAAKALQAAQGLAGFHEAAAQATLQARPSSPDSCVSAEALIRQKLSERGKN